MFFDGKYSYGFSSPFKKQKIVDVEITKKLLNKINRKGFLEKEKNTIGDK